MKTETFDNAADFRAAVQGKPRTKRGQSTRPDLPRAAAGTGDRIEQITRIAAFGYSPRWDAGSGFCFWDCRTGARTTAHASYASACVAAERELSG